MDELEGRLQTLTRLSPPTADELGADVLHERATKVRRRSQLALAVPAAALVVLVLAAALALRTRPSGDETVPAGSPDSVRTGSALSPRELEVLDWVDTTVTLRQQLMHEMLATATFLSTAKGNRDELDAARRSTDQAHVAFEAKSAQVHPDDEGQAMRDAMKQFTNRARALPTIRRSVDAMQNNAAGLVQDYANTINDLANTTKALTVSTTSADMLRGLLSSSNLATLTDQEAWLAGLLTIPVETRFYASVLPTSLDPEAKRNNSLGVGCGEDASAGAGSCKLYDDIVEANDRVSLFDQTFQELADAERKMLKRKADAGSFYDELKRHAIEDGQGHNDLTGTQVGTTNVEVGAFRRAARDRLDKLITAERELLTLLRSPQAAPPGTAVTRPTGG